jgi:hypothetical protein
VAVDKREGHLGRFFVALRVRHPPGSQGKLTNAIQAA